MSQPTRLHRLIVMVSLALWAAFLQPLAAQNYVLQLCNETNCNTPIIQLPRIDSVFLFSNVTPGGMILVKGRGLERTTQLILKLVDFTGQPTLPLLTLSEVGPTFIGARISGGVAGVMDQQGLLQVRTRSNLFSNEFPVGFRATRDTRIIPPGDSAVRMIHCGQDSNWDVCNGWRDPDDERPGGFGGGPPLATIQAGHHNCFACPSTDRGEDTYRVVLSNGWVLESMDWYGVHKTTPQDEAWAYQPSFPAGATGWRPIIKWYATSDDTAHYAINVHITGPIGVPWR